MKRCSAARFGQRSEKARPPGGRGRAFRLQRDFERVSPQNRYRLTEGEVDRSSLATVVSWRDIPSYKPKNCRAKSGRSGDWVVAVGAAVIAKTSAERLAREVRGGAICELGEGVRRAEQRPTQRRHEACRKSFYIVA